MKKITIIAFILFEVLFASDPISVDSLYKKQIGLRSITNLSLLSSGNANIYNTYPSLSINGDLVLWDETKQLALTQTLIYSLTSSLDIMGTFGGSYVKNEYTNFRTLEPISEDRVGFDSVWAGLNYRGDSFSGLVPMINFQVALFQKERVKRENKNFNLKSYSIKGSLRGYTDPVIYSIYVGAKYNAERNFGFAKLSYGHNLYFGGDLSIVLSPKITLDLGIEQGFQTANKLNGKKTTNIRSIPTYNVGSTYSINDDTSITFSATFGGSSAAPDSIFGISLWKKF